MAVLQLPWHYASTPHCLLQGNEIEDQTKENLIERLTRIANERPTDLRKALAPTQSAGGTPPLIDEVAAVAAYAGKSGKSGDPLFQWNQWPDGLALHFRRGIGDALLSRYGLVLPWPPPAPPVPPPSNPPEPTRPNAVIKQVAEQGQTYPGLNESKAQDFDFASGLALTPFMKAADDAVMPKRARREFTDHVNNATNKDKAATEWITERAARMYGGGAYPPTVTVTYEGRSRPRIRSEWAIDTATGALKLHLGGSDDPDEPDDVARLYQYPCGALNGY